MSEFLVVHATGDRHTFCLHRMVEQCRLIGQGSSVLIQGVAFARYPEGRGVELFAPVGTKCLRATIRGADQAECNARAADLAQLLESGATEFPDWLVELSWNHGGGGGP